MITWMGGADTSAWSGRALVEGGHGFRLTSFFYLSGKRKMINPSDFRFFLDSGAYSAWSRGTQIDLDEYCAFIKANIELLEVYACLDVVPGVPGRPATSQERVDAAEQSWTNYLYMVGEGLSPLPVFHYGEDFKYLDRILDYGCDYVGIGGLVSIPSAMRRAWLDRLFVRITDKDGKPTVKTHGFGMTAVPLIFRYPWHSIDSTTWIQITSNGGVYLPAMVNNEFVFDRVPLTVAVSGRNPKQMVGGKSAATMSKGMREILDRWLKFCGKTYDEVVDHYYHRAVVNVMFFRMVAEAKAERPFNVATLRKQSLWETEQEED